MKRRCPLNKTTYCEGSSCALAGDENGNCLIHKLLVQLTKANEPIKSYDEVPEFKPSIRTGDFCPWDF